MPLSSYRRPYERVRALYDHCGCSPARSLSHTGGMPTDLNATRSTKNGFPSAACPPTTGQTFEEVVLPHLDAAYRLARWLMRDDADAEDAVQEASLRAFRYFRTFVGGNGRAWFLRIVRNTCVGWRGHSLHTSTDPFDEEQHSKTQPALDPETLALRGDDVRLLERAMNNLPDRFRELLVLRELEGLSYRELGEVIGIPTGTVMSGLSRARQALGRALSDELRRAGPPKEQTTSRKGGRGNGVNRVDRTNSEEGRSHPGVFERAVRVAGVLRRLRFPQDSRHGTVSHAKRKSPRSHEDTKILLDFMPSSLRG